MIQISYGTAAIQVEPAVAVTSMHGKVIENYDARDLVAAVNAVVRALALDQERFIDMLREDGL